MLAVKVTIEKLALYAKRTFIRTLADQFAWRCNDCGFLWVVHASEPCEHLRKVMDDYGKSKE